MRLRLGRAPDAGPGRRQAIGHLGALPRLSSGCPHGLTGTDPPVSRQACPARGGRVPVLARFR